MGDLAERIYRLDTAYTLFTVSISMLQTTHNVRKKKQNLNMTSTKNSGESNNHALKQSEVNHVQLLKRVYVYETQS